MDDPVKYQMIYKWIKGAAILALLGVSEVAIATNHCIIFPRESTNPVVEVCEHDTQFKFRIGDDVTVFESQQFKTKISIAIGEWLDKHDLSEAKLESGKVEIWMSVPESNPTAAQPRAIVETLHGKLSFWFDLHAGEWSLDDKESAVLGKDDYPNSFGHRPSRVIVKAQKGVSSATATEALLDAGAHEVSEQGGGWYAASCDVFNERTVAALALKTHADVLQYAQVNSVVECIADRQMAFQFKMNSLND